VRLGSTVTRVKTMFKFGLENGLLARMPR